MSSKLSLRLAVKGVSEPGCQDQILAGGGNFSFFLRGLPNANFPAGGDGNTTTFVLSRGWWNQFVRPGRMATLPSCSKAPKILVPKVRYWKVGGDGGNLLWNSWK